jgi:hypothetical protein
MYEGHVPDNSKMAKIRNWPLCKNITNIHTFLGIMGYMRIWIKNYLTITCLLHDLTCKYQPFVWRKEHVASMQALKDAIVHSTALISIDYKADHTIYLAINSSVQGVGWIVSQDCANRCRCPSRFGSIAWNECKSHYSQAKIELYSLFCALRAMHFHLINIHKLVVEMDALYIRGMLDHPDIQPNTTINCWIATILLFNFKLVHIPVEKHHGPDGLSWRKPADSEDENEDNPKEWSDRTLVLRVWVVSWLEATLTNDSTATWTLKTHDNSPP